MAETEKPLDELDVFEEMRKEKPDFSKFPLNLLIRAEYHARLEYDRIKKMASLWNNIYDMLSIYVVPERMDEEGEEGKRLKGIGRVELRPDMWVKTEDSDSLKEWLRERGWGDMVVPTVNSSTLKALIKEQMKLGKKGQVPDESLVKITPYTRAVIVKG